MVQVVALVLWLGFFFAIAALVNLVVRRPLMNPWWWFGGGYAAAYAVDLYIGLMRPDLSSAYTAYFPITLGAIGLCAWRAPKWRAAKQQETRGAA